MEERSVQAYGLEVFSSESLGCVALGPVVKQHVVTGNVYQSKLPTYQSLKAKSEKRAELVVFPSRASFRDLTSLPSSQL